MKRSIFLGVGLAIASVACAPTLDVGNNQGGGPGTAIWRAGQPSDGRELEYVATGFLPRERELLEYVTTVLGGR